VSSIAYEVAPRAVDVLPARATRRVTRRDGLLPLVFALELLAGVAFGVAAGSGQSTATGVPARLTLAPVAQVTVLASPPTAPPFGPAVGPLLPGTVRPPAAPDLVTVAPPAAPKHAPRNPFGVLVRTAV
jgi:hypothetical protein